MTAPGQTTEAEMLEGDLNISDEAHSGVLVGLTPQAIEQVAGRVAQLLQQNQSKAPEPVSDTPTGLLTVKQLAQHLGLTRTWVYEHAGKLGAFRLSDGPKARMRFDLDTAMAGLAQHRQQTAPVAPILQPRRRRRSNPYRTDVPLLPIYEPPPVHIRPTGQEED
jgi:hypothetical protein